MNYITKEELDKSLQPIKDEIADVKDNHLGSIEAAILWLVRDIDRLWKAFGAGIGILALVIALVELLG